ncbi:MAG TPA: GYD domain-containing protein [Lysobacter sp.]|nr:GYD domain-containing protein [Lysobacter sp.]
MATYIALSRFTDQGIRSIKDTTKRADAAKEAAKKFGANMTHIFWTLGHYDLVTIIEASDEQAVTALMLSISSAGNIRTETLRAFDQEEMGGILAKVP